MKTLTLRHFGGLAVASAVAFAPIAALAHGKLESATPASGSTVDVAPDALRLTFNEDLESTFSSVKIADATGALMTKEKAKIDASNPRVMTLAVPKLASGAYTVQWAVMTADAHKTKGTYTFKVK
ncbi:copper resistance protein CopC [Burkholderia diffusa]|uniref:Copper resistance protein CopC n=1 Tax=Burkholderia diffusa TaxID=488732 RepID=A0AAW3PKA5_9BURK|nr:copper homeostasis periplasmic binding protein CopC [Burkholderia diffusa]KWF26787.1 copper resistance protein CopC [Burkholderia diffusa]KWF31742.1 copper resistance protein CopC [Burkholderia diffusa]KWF39558.1 copper resistance protein CopC [Burkholderia diffusa]KWF57337.1 copper resistance protein CopC [Burkholderia diffusa]